MTYSFNKERKEALFSFLNENTVFSFTLLGIFNINLEHYKYLEYVFLKHILLFLSNIVTSRAHKKVTKSSHIVTQLVIDNVNQWVWALPTKELEVLLQSSFSPPDNWLWNASNHVSLLYFYSNFSEGLPQSVVFLTMEAVPGWVTWWSPHINIMWEDRPTTDNVKDHKKNALCQRL